MSNVFSFTGTIGQDAEVKYLPSGAAVLSVSVANNVGYSDKQQTMWIRVAVFGKRAEGQLVNYLKKGTAVFVSGELRTNQYKANDGTVKTTLELTANILDLVGKKQDTQSPPQAYPAQDAHGIAKANGYQHQTIDSTGTVVDEWTDDIAF